MTYNFKTISPSITLLPWRRLSLSKYNSINLKCSVPGDLRSDCTEYLAPVPQLNGLLFEDHLPSTNLPNWRTLSSQTLTLLIQMYELFPGKPQQQPRWVSPSVSQQNGPAIPRPSAKYSLASETTTATMQSLPRVFSPSITLQIQRC